MRDKSDRYQVQVNNSPRTPKRLGGYLLEAGLLTTDQVDVALNDQQATGIEWIMRRIIMPEREAYARWEKSQQTLVQERTVLQPRLVAKQAMNKMAQAAAQPAPTAQAKPTAQPAKAPTTAFGSPNSTTPTSSFGRRDAPIAKPLPPVNSSDNDVSWVG